MFSQKNRIDTKPAMLFSALAQDEREPKEPPTPNLHAGLHLRGLTRVPEPKHDAAPHTHEVAQGSTGGRTGGGKASGHRVYGSGASEPPPPSEGMW